MKNGHGAVPPIPMPKPAAEPGLSFDRATVLAGTVATPFLVLTPWRIHQSIRTLRTCLPGVEPCHGSRRTTFCGYLKNRARWIATKQNDPAAAPAAAHSHRRFGQRADQASIEVEPLEVPIGIKRNRTAIRRPERKDRTAGPGQRARRDRVD